MKYEFDVCVIGSGAGGGPIAYSLAEAGFSVVVLEKGKWHTEKDFAKDELASSLRSTFTPDLRKEPHVVQYDDDQGKWHKKNTYRSGWNFWNGNVVGGSSNFMSGFFHRLKPVDFHLKSEFGAVEGGNVADWPISYHDLEPYYDKVERVVGVSGKVVKHPHQEPRSSANFPYPPTAEHPVSDLIDEACDTLGIHAIPTPRAVLSRPALNRSSCSYNGYCGNYGCATGAKGSSRAALLDQAVKTGRCKVITEAMVAKLESDQTGKITHVKYIDKHNDVKGVNARIYVVACQAIETSRLLLMSKGVKHPNGLGNNHGQVGKNLLFAAGGAGSGRVLYSNLSEQKAKDMHEFGTFVNRAVQDWYVIKDKQFFDSPQKGGTIDFVHLHPNPVVRSIRQINGRDGLIWGKPLKRKLEAHFTEGKFLKIEAFCDFMPNDDCHVSLDETTTDQWGLPVAKVKVSSHVRNLQVGWYLASKGADVLKQMGAENVVYFASGAPATNLLAGGCRFGTDPTQSVLNPDCRVHDVENLYVSDGSFMPTGGSVPYTWTIYANSFRVADKIIDELGGRKNIPTEDIITVAV